MEIPTNTLSQLRTSEKVCHLVGLCVEFSISQLLIFKYQRDRVGVCLAWASISWWTHWFCG